MVAVSTISVSVELVFTNYTNANFIPAMTLSVSQGTKAFEILEMASQQNPCYRFQFQTFSIGRFITRICCLEQDPSADFYWLIYKNGQPSNVGVDVLTPTNGDTITFKYQNV
ncbi:Hypothetical predicted protein [Paramuricea clavata]|uniref:Transcobalamin-like C-terminal domain-containing protein n=1 Tax=Paramuricea clavata TaxID=317549 RepID=A0A6S7HNV5_PARCT|nr:Hypothetical predicted protein [Paramuricea clavata]